MKTIQSKKHTTALWLGDLHLDQTTDRQRRELFDRIHETDSECVVVSGDISTAPNLEEHLRRLASACAPRPVYFVAGNHDYHGSGIHEMGFRLAALTKSVENLHFLDGTRIFPLGGGVCLTGHGGWADARAGYGQNTVIDTPDRHAIRDFHGMSQKQALRKMTDLGKESAAMIRATLPLALTRYRHVVIATHVPPFPTAVMYNNKPCGDTHLPHFANLSAGLAIIGIAKSFPRRRITILSGHSHSDCAQTVLPNLTIRVGHARTGKPDMFELINL